MNAKSVRRVFLVCVFLIVLFGTGFLGVQDVSAMGALSVQSYVSGSAGNIVLSNNTITSYTSDFFVGYLTPVPGKCTDQPIFNLTGDSNTDNQLFSISIDGSGVSSLEHLELDLGRDEFHIQVELVCFLAGVGEVGYEDSFTLYMAPEIHIGGDETIKVGEPFGRLGSFVDPGPENTWSLFVNYGDVPGEYIEGWQPLDFNADSNEFELYHQYAYDGRYTVSVRAVENERGYVGEESIFLTVEHSPIADAGGPYNILEHGDVHLDASGSSDSQDTIVSYDWDLNNDGYFDDAHESKIPTWYADDTGGPFKVSVKVTNSRGQFDIDSAYVYVSNVDPVLNTCVGGSIDEGKTFTSSGSFIDPGLDYWTATVDYGDGSGVQPLILNGKNFDLSHKYSDNGLYSVEVIVTDDDGGQDSCNFSVTVNNVKPSMDIGTDITLNREQAFSRTVMFTDPGTDTWTATIDYGDGGGIQTLELSEKNFTLTHSYLSLGTYTVVATVNDGDGGEVSDSLIVSVINVVPIVEAGDNAIVKEGEKFDGIGSFIDPDNDIWTIAVDYGDGSYEVQLHENPDKTFVHDHVYIDEGTFTVTAEVYDNVGGIGTDTLSITVTNTLPTISLPNNAVLNESSFVQVLGQGDISDPGQDVLSVNVDYGDGSGTQTLINNLGPYHTLDLEHAYLQDGTYTVTVWAVESQGTTASASMTVTVNNLPPYFDWQNNIFTNAIYTMQERQFFAGVGDEVDFQAVNVIEYGPLDTLTYRWDFGDGDSAIGQNVSHIFPGVGNYTVSLTVTDGDGGSCTDYIFLEIQNNLPAININEQAYSNEGDTFNESGYISDPDGEWWTATVDYGDGSGVQELSLNPDKTFTLTHTYVDPGEYILTINATDSYGGTGTRQMTVYVSNVPPVISEIIVQESHLDEGDVANFSAVVSASAADTLSYDWYFSDDETFAIGTSVSHLFSQSGTYLVSLHVIDDDYESDNEEITVTIHNVAPTVNAGVDLIVEAGQPFSSSGSFTDPGADAWNATVDYGDGNGPQPLQLNFDKTFGLSETYNTPGVYTVTVTVMDQDYDIGSDSFIVTVENPQSSNQSPAVNVGGDGSIDEGGIFTSSGSFSDPDEDLWTASVDYGDGSGTQVLALNGKNFALAHTYTADGTYTITVTIEDGTNPPVSDSLTVMVSNVAPTITEATASISSLDEGGEVQFSATATDPGNDALTYTWNFGDGSTAIGASVSYIYADEGFYEVLVEVDDGDGGVVTSSVTIQVSNIAPTVEAGSDFTINSGQTFASAGFFADPGVDSWTATVDYGDGSGVQPLALNADQTFAFGHTYAAVGSYTVTITVDDGDGGVDSDTMIVTVDDSVQVGGSMTLNGMILTPGGFGLPCDYFKICTRGLEFRLPEGVADNELFDVNNFFNAENPELSYAELIFVGPADPNRTEYSITVELVCTKADGTQDIYTGTFTITIQASNMPPVLDVGEGLIIDEGGAFIGAGSFTDPDDDTWSATVDYGDGSGVQQLVLSSDKMFDLNHIYADNAAYLITVTVDDGVNPLVEETLTVIVGNIAPTVEAGSDFTINTGQTFNGLGSFVDPGVDTWTATVDYGDGSGVQSLGLNADKTFAFGHAYAAEGSYTVTITVEDDDGGAGSDTVTVTVTEDNSIQVGEFMSLNGMILTPGGFGLPCDYFKICTGGLEFRLPEGVADNDLFDVNNFFNAENPELSYAELIFVGPADPNRTEYSIAVELVCIKADGSVEIYSDTFTVSIQYENIAPEIQSINASIAPVEIYTSIIAEAVFVDPDFGDSHTAVWDWGDGTSSEGIVDNKTVSGSHEYQSTGVYVVTLTVTDSWGASDKDTFQYLVVYDPSSGFVTGGGWITSPLGAYAADPTLTGKATFGFVSKYKKGANLPSGNTEFQFHAGDLNFKSTAYNWLVIAGDKAMFKGTGTINGEGSYGFMVSAVDGDLDKFRIKIWNLDTEAVVYDNQAGAVEDAEPVTVIEGGSIVIHKSK